MAARPAVQFESRELSREREERKSPSETFQRLLKQQWSLSHYTSPEYSDDGASKDEGDAPGRYTFYNTPAIERWIEDNIDDIIDELSQRTPDHNTGQSPFPISREDILEGKQRCVRVLAILLAVGHGRFLKDFRDAHFVDANIDKTHLEGRIYGDALSQHLQERYPNNELLEDVIKAWEDSKWSFCVVEINLGMAEHYTEAVVLPFCEKIRIGEGGTSIVYKVAVPEIFVGETLRNTLGPPERLEKHGKCYIMALKSYSNEFQTLFHHEKNILSRLSPPERSSKTFRLDGIIRYFGSFSISEYTGHAWEERHNLLLEYGAQDLDEYMADPGISPPASMEEILRSYNSVFDIALVLKKMQNLQLPDSDWRGCHSDVKPDNILIVKNNFKLIDFGFSAFSRDTQGDMLAASGFTKTYGAPEIQDGKQVTHNIDTWSFGCVLLVFATWVVLGRQGVLQFEKLRIMSIRQINDKDEKHDRNLRAIFDESASLAAQDSFHDGHKMLPAIEGWIRRLKNSIRVCDTVTAFVLELVERYMLLPKASSRLGFTVICEKWADHQQLADTAYKKKIKEGIIAEHDDDASIDQLLLAIERAAYEATSESSNSSQNGFHIAVGPKTFTIPFQRSTKSRRIEKSDKLDKVVLTPTPHRKEILQEILSKRHKQAPPQPEGMQPQLGGISHRRRVSIPNSSRSPVRQPTTSLVPTLSTHRESEQPVETTDQQPLYPKPLSVRTPSLDVPKLSISRPSAHLTVQQTLKEPRPRALVANETLTNGGPVQPIELQGCSPGMEILQGRPEEMSTTNSAKEPAIDQPQSPRISSPKLGHDEIPTVRPDGQPSYPVSAPLTSGLHIPNTPQGSFHSHKNIKDQRSSASFEVIRTPLSSPKQSDAQLSQQPHNYGLSNSYRNADPQSIEELPYDIFTSRRRMSRSVSNSKGFMQKFEGIFKSGEKRSGSDYFATRLQNRDITIIVDNSSSSEHSRFLVAFIVETLAQHMTGCVENGLSLYFTNSLDSLPMVKSNVADKFREVLLSPQIWQREGRVEKRTDMAEILQKRYTEYLQLPKSSPPRASTLLVITDGLWSDMEPENKVETELVAFIRAMTSRWPNLKDRHYTIQFIRVGHDPTSKSRLQRLDDQLCLEQEYTINGQPFPDVVDHTHWTGKVQKMICGSFRPGDDREAESDVVESYVVERLCQEFYAELQSKRSRKYQRRQSSIPSIQQSNWSPSAEYPPL
ncbi:hypothetical protein BT63DRAFT_456036 [Microthyrium microscopicum]|uniref:Protein kinase domain-containing protein n=1 Tax=Microthyrium microscopicum TaxID=703497 RepID=A0A6A6UAC6_9PEZI|nr:hypothetical protein BT63DRAFT_456036 [Microthyrium microscopicum]